MAVNVLTIAGSDPSGGAGLQVDLKAFQARGVYGCAVPTCITVQTTKGVRQVKALDPQLVGAQLDALLEDTTISVIKIGALCNAPVVRAVARSLQRHPDIPIVLDPIILSTSGHRLLDDHGVWAMTETLLPRARLLTPNADEASVLSRMPVRTEPEARQAAMALQALGAQAVLVKGGHLEDGEAIDILFDGTAFHAFTGPRLAIGKTHGTGCLFSSLIAAELAKGKGVVDAVHVAKELLVWALARGATVNGTLLPDVFALQGGGAGTP